MGCESRLPHKLESSRSSIFEDFNFLSQEHFENKTKQIAFLLVDFIFKEKSGDSDACAGPSEPVWSSISHFPQQLCLPDTQTEV